MARAKTATVSTTMGSASFVTEPGWPMWADPLATQRLRNVLRENHIGHAYLLSGPQGVGKAALARAFSQSLCCTTVDRDDLSQPCGDCRACRNVLRGAHPDVEYFDLKTQSALSEKPSSRATLSIDTVRRLRSTAALLPLEALRRVLIVDDAEAMLEPAQQALLKTLEEPPPTVTLLLLADEPEALLETVRSRCQQIVLRPRAESDVTTMLVDRGVESTLAHEISVLSRGCPAWALDAASDVTVLQARRSDRDFAASWIASSPYDRLVTAYKLGEQFQKRRFEVLGVVLGAVQILREEMLQATSDVPALTAASPNAISGSAALLMSQAVAASLQCLGDLESNVRPRLALEAMVMQWPNLEHRQA